MVVHLTPDQEAQLQQIAVQNGEDADELARKIFERYLAYEAAESEALALGIEQADQGVLVAHEEVVARFNKPRNP